VYVYVIRTFVLKVEVFLELVGGDQQTMTYP